MKRILLAGFVLGIFSILGARPVGAEVPTPSPETPTPIHPSVVNLVDDINVPLDVLMYVQQKYQGYAVTHAKKLPYKGVTAYQLRVDRDDIANDYSSLYLYYDMSWKLVGEAPTIAPPTPKLPEKKTEPEKKSTEQPTVKPNEQGGRGGGDQTTVQPTTTTTTTTQPADTTTQPTDPAPTPTQTTSG